jgi:hypothetical protein
MLLRFFDVLDEPSDFDEQSNPFLTVRGILKVLREPFTFSLIRDCHLLHNFCVTTGLDVMSFSSACIESQASRFELTALSPTM